MKYQQLKRIAKELKRPVTELLALSPQNDPFYAGTPSDIEKAEWFTSLWHQCKFASGVHLRRVHYALVSQPEPVLKPDGLPYENTEVCWSYLCMAGKMARYLNLVAIDAFEDRRNPPPVECAVFPESGLTWELGQEYDRGELVAAFLPYPRLPKVNIHLALSQGYLIEVWCEKSTMNDVLMPLCQSFGCNLVTGLGELSVTACHRLVERVRLHDKPTRILYISDFDPAGQSMPVAVARKVEFLLQNCPGADVQLESIALTQAQCENYRLPRTPIKESERRAISFQERHGEGATELDALEAIHPGSLRRIVQTQIQRFYDGDLRWRGADLLDSHLETISEIEAEVQSDFALENAQIQSEYEALCADVRERLEQICAAHHSLIQRYGERICERMESLDAIVIPQPAPGDEWENPLFDSSRPYLEQMDHYRRHQGKT